MYITSDKPFSQLKCLSVGISSNTIVEEPQPESALIFCNMNTLDRDTLLRVSFFSDNTPLKTMGHEPRRHVSTSM